MAYPIVTGANIMDDAAVYLNDPSRTVFTYAKQLPMLNTAVRELNMALEQNNVSITNRVSTAITVDAGVVTIDFSTTPALPNDFVELRELWERLDGSDDDYVPMSRREFLPGFTEQTSSLVYFAWLNQQLKFIGATTDRQLRLDYIALSLAELDDETDDVRLINGRLFLAFRTAALCAEFIGENPTRAASLNGNAAFSLDRCVSINVKGKQSYGARRRPFRSAYKSLTGWW